MSEAPLMVGVSGLRGIVGKSLTPEVATRFGAAVGMWLVREGARARGFEGSRGTQRPAVLLGRDGRSGGETIMHAAAAGLASAGCDVSVAEVMMTPTMGVAVDVKGFSAGMMVTASHNPQEWNGLKVLVRDWALKEMVVSAAAPARTTAEEIIEIFAGGSGTGRDAGDVESFPEGLPGAMHAALVNEVLPTIASGERRVVLDCVGGAGAIISPEFLRRNLGCDVEVTGDFSDGVFPHTPEPTRENLQGLCKLVKQTKADVGFAQDPDADRLAIVDERGEYIGEEYTLVLAAEALLSETAKQRDSETGGKKDRVLVTNLSTSRMIDDVAARHGAKVLRTPVGEANVVEAMKREAAAGRDVVVGGEGNGGVIWPRVTYVRDSLSAMGLVLGLMARRKQKLSEIVASMPSYAIEKRKVELARKEDARPSVGKIAKEYRAERVDLQDGVRVDFSRGSLAGKAWLHVRASNTEPIMRLIAEAPTAAEARGVLDEAARVIGG